jgi:hypothetical protein
MVHKGLTSTCKELRKVLDVNIWNLINVTLLLEIPKNWYFDLRKLKFKEGTIGFYRGCVIYDVCRCGHEESLY